MVLGAWRLLALGVGGAAPCWGLRLWRVLAVRHQGILWEAEGRGWLAHQGAGVSQALLRQSGSPLYPESWQGPGKIGGTRLPPCWPSLRSGRSLRPWFLLWPLCCPRPRPLLPPSPPPAKGWAR